MKTHLALAGMLTLAIAASAQETVANLDWKVMQQSGTGAFSGGVVTTDGKSILQIAATDAGLETRLLTITNPPISKKLYAITGQIKYENVSGDGFLEMWNYFPPLKPGMPEGKFFSRTMAQFGELGRINGTSDWRKFTVPFNSDGASGAPTRLELNIVLPGKGNVYVGPLKLVVFEPNQLGAIVKRGWWGEDTWRWIGVIGGPLVGCFGALLGWLAKTGRARTFVIVGLRAIAIIGVLLIIAGFLALLWRQPYPVWLPMLLFGLILASIVFQLPTIQRRYEELELRRMNSIDAMAG